MLGAFPTIKPPGPKNKARQIFLQEPLDSFLPPPREDASANQKKKLPGISGKGEADDEPPFVSPLDPKWARQPDRQPPRKPPSADEAAEAAGGGDSFGPLPASTGHSTGHRSQKKRPLPPGQPKNYIGAGRPVTPTPPRQAPDAFAALRRAATCGAGDAASCALPHSLMFAAVGGAVAVAGLDLTGWMVHDDDLQALAQCAW
jgi:hypothetical protein